MYEYLSLRYPYIGCACNHCFPLIWFAGKSYLSSVSYGILLILLILLYLTILAFSLDRFHVRVTLTAGNWRLRYYIKSRN